MLGMCRTLDPANAGHNVGCMLQVVRPAQMRKGFQTLIAALDDLCLDVPEAADLLALFIARAIVDDILPPSFLAQQNISAGSHDFCTKWHSSMVDHDLPDHPIAAKAVSSRCMAPLHSMPWLMSATCSTQERPELLSSRKLPSNIPRLDLIAHNACIQIWAW